MRLVIVNGNRDPKQTFDRLLLGAPVEAPAPAATTEEEAPAPSHRGGHAKGQAAAARRTHVAEEKAAEKAEKAAEKAAEQQAIHVPLTAPGGTTEVEVEATHPVFVSVVWKDGTRSAPAQAAKQSDGSARLTVS